MVVEVTGQGAYIEDVRQGGGSLGDLVFGTRETLGDANTINEEASHHISR